MNTTQTKAQLVADVMHLAMTAHTKIEPCIMLMFFGHVDTLTITIRESKREYGHILATKDIQLEPIIELSDEDLEQFEQNTLQELTQLKESLETCIQTGVLDENWVQSYR